MNYCALRPPFIITDFEDSEERFFHVIPCFFLKFVFFLRFFFPVSYRIIGYYYRAENRTRKKKIHFRVLSDFDPIIESTFWASDNRFEIALSDNPISVFVDCERNKYPLCRSLSHPKKITQNRHFG